VYSSVYFSSPDPIRTVLAHNHRESIQAIFSCALVVAYSNPPSETSLGYELLAMASVEDLFRPLDLDKLVDPKNELCLEMKR
jgi:hypothetical protein